MGAGQRLIPEQLNRKIFDTLGYPWLQVKANGTYDRRIALLNDRNWYQLMYGGIDNREVVKRDRNPSPISAAIARRMAVQMACLTVPQEFSYTDPEERRLFRFVDLETTVESDELAIQKQVQWLFLALYGEHLHLTHTEIAHAVALFDDIQSEFSNYDTCFNDVAGLLTEYFENKADLEACLLDRGYAGNYIGAPIETVNLCLASLDDTYTTTSQSPPPTMQHWSF